MLLLLLLSQAQGTSLDSKMQNTADFWSMTVSKIAKGQMQVPSEQLPERGELALTRRVQTQEEQRRKRMMLR